MDRYRAAESFLTAALILLIGTLPCFPSDLTRRLADFFLTDVEWPAFILAILRTPLPLSVIELTIPQSLDGEGTLIEGGRLAGLGSGRPCAERSAAFPPAIPPG
jgi:hypothetical protein